MCKHEDFAVEANVARIEDIGRFQMDVSVKCSQCGKPFRFLGLPIGVNYDAAMTNLNGTVATMGIYPVDERGG